MLLEALIATTCIVENSGCGEATSAYYQSNKELQESVKHLERQAQVILDRNKYLVYVATPAIAAISGKPAVIKLHRTLNLNLDFKQSSVALQWNW